MSTPDERREAAQRRITVSSLAPTPTKGAPVTRSYRALGQHYATLSVKVPTEMADAVANYAAAQEISVSEAVRSCITSVILDSTGGSGNVLDSTGDGTLESGDHDV